VILFVRHGQASAGAADYDVLSATGELQSEMLGTALRRRGVSAARVVAGSLRRQQETARCASRKADWAADLECDEAWNEFHHEDVRAVHGDLVADRSALGSDAMPWLDRAIPRWSSGLHDQDYAEPFPAFTERVDTALHKMAAETAPGATAVVFTSAGVVGWIAASLLGGAEPQWRRLNQVAINSGVTRVLVGSRGITLASFNEHHHLPPRLVTYR
jgi:broad specificity phosphatase PhoE